MWDDEINKNIRDAADQYHPAYDENAWDKMELLLNEHLPVDNKRKKRFLYFFTALAVLLLAGSLLGLYNHNGSISNIPGKEVTKNRASNSRVQTEAAKSSLEPVSLSGPNRERPTLNPGAGAMDVKPAENNGSLRKIAYRTANDHTGAAFKPLEGKNSSDGIMHANREKLKPNIIENGQEHATVSGTPGKKEMINENGDAGIKDIEKPNTASNVPGLKKEISQLKKDTSTNKDFEKNNKTKKQAPNTKFNKNFSVGFSAGPDISSTGLNHIGKVSINYGIGAGYNISGLFTLRTGFYVSEKLYSAGKNDYQLPAGSNANYLYNITANCKVYEIPVTVSYNFSRRKSHQWFVAGGLSSYLMKKESYDYYYKYPSGYVDSKSWSISNQNQHYFAILDISGGYEYSFNKKLSLTTEPYLKIPLVGVGAGKVKLNSGGILFTLRVKPFYNQ